MINVRYLFHLLIIMLIAPVVYGQKIEVLQLGEPVSIRGLSVVDDDVAWVSGSKGYVALTTDGGKTWGRKQVKGFEQADFRDIEAFSDKEAIIISSGTPALILKTTDGGQSWQLKYRNDDKAYFLDAMDFAGKKHGLVLGDPVDHKFLLLETNDAGENWHPFADMPGAVDGEAAFAASGTCLRLKGNVISIATGGSIARLLTNRGAAWQAVRLPVAQGKDSKGAFSVSGDLQVVAGGNYASDKLADSVACISTDNTRTTFKPGDKGPAGYQSCVELLAPHSYLSTGTSGTNLSADGGKTWQLIDATSFNVCRKAKSGRLVLLAGDKGKIGVLHL